MINQGTHAPAFRWGFIGCGGQASRAAETVSSAPQHSLVAVLGRSAEKTGEFCSRFGGEAYTDMAAFLAREDMDCVYIATTTISHYEHVLAALESGHNVLVEKPFAMNYLQARHLIDCARERGLYLCEAFWHDFFPAVRQAERWIGEGLVGELTGMEASYISAAVSSIDAQPDRYLRMLDPEKGGGVLLEFGLYPIHYAARFFGRPEAVSCRMEKTVTNVDGIDDLVLKYGDREVKIFASCCNEVSRRMTGLKYMLFGLLGSQTTELGFFGSKGGIFLPRASEGEELHLYSAGHKEYFQAAGGLIHEFNAVAGEIMAGKKQSSFVPHEETLIVMEIIDECRRQGGLYYNSNFEKDMEGYIYGKDCTTAAAR